MEYYDPMEVLDTFKISYVHGENWPRHVFATAIFEDFRPFVAKTEPGMSHAEEKVLDYFKHMLSKYRVSFVNIKLFLSASPCGECSEKIVRFMSKNRLHLEIVFAGLYKITRPSCARNPDCQLHSFPSDHEHIFNVEGLRTLYRTQGVFLHTFTGRDWFHLKVAMGVPSYDCTSRQDEDSVLRRDFEEIMKIRSSASFPESALPTEPPMLERAFRGQTARGSSLYESHSRPFMCSFPNMHPQMNLSVYHDDGNYQSWDPGMHDTSTYPVTRPRDVDHMYTAHRAPAGRYMTTEYDSDTRRSNYSYPFAFGHKHTSVQEWDKFM